MVAWLRSSVDRRPALIAALAVAASVGGGMVIEVLALPRRPDIVAIGVDLVTGLALCLCGVVAWLRRPDSRIGPAFLLAGVLWFASTAMPGDTLVRYAHRGPVIYALLAFPARGPWQRDRGAITAAVLAGAAGPLWSWTPTAIGLAGLLAVWAIGRIRIPGWLDRPRARVAAWSSLGLAATIAAIQLVGVIGPSAVRSAWSIVSYDLVLVVVVASLTARLLAPRDAVLADLVIELGVGEGGTVRDRLADALADPSVEIAYARPDGLGYADELGAAIDVPTTGPSRAITPILRDGQTIAVIVHDPGRAGDPELERATQVAATLLQRHAALSGALAVEVATLEASRRRLALAADVERARIEGRLRSGPIGRLRSIESALVRSRQALLAGGVEDQADLQRAMANVAEGIRELETLGRGLRPPRLVDAGLRAALADLGREFALPVRLRIDTDRLPAAVETAVYFVAVEALVNVAKHAQATRASIELHTTGDRVRLQIVDDGVGGASVDAGSGLRGLRDRLLSLGGDLDVSSGRGRGTTIRAAIPLGTVTGEGR